MMNSLSVILIFEHFRSYQAMEGKSLTWTNSVMNDIMMSELSFVGYTYHAPGERFRPNSQFG
ncbi:hypothetical protein H5410_050342 [Solanum commersonii]|uniref:Uncharacterized protein n=1 Tax=Solanum commersonii TaxID=4109 RepID=A0A9J5WV66_SOLCO|nr:hypothetical protein H5410_050342 [Solanum commersonii]